MSPYEREDPRIAAAEWARDNHEDAVADRWSDEGADRYEQHMRGEDR